MQAKTINSVAYFRNQLLKVVCLKRRRRRKKEEEGEVVMDKEYKLVMEKE